MNVIIVATTKVLHMNLSVYKKEPEGNIQVIELNTDVRDREAHLKFMWYPKNSSHNHCYAILLFDNSGELLDQDRWGPARQQIMAPQHDYEVIDLTDECGTNPMQQLVSFPYNKIDMQSLSYLSVNIAPDWVDHLPEDIDGMRLFKNKMFA